MWTYRRFSKLRPSNGDSVQTCGHSNASHFFFDATDHIDHLRWIALCQSCFVAHGHEPEVAVEQFAAAQSAA
jgi:hypothetical protein